MNDEILKLAEKCGDWNGQTVEMNDVGIETFYKQAFNAGLEAAAKHLDTVEAKYAAKWEEMGESYYEGYRDCADVSAGQIRGLVEGEK